MRDMVKMVLVIAILSSFSGGLLAGIRIGTKDRIEIQQLEFVKGPAIRAIFEGFDNDPIADRFKLTDNGSDVSFFVGIKNGTPQAVTFESFGKGFGGDIGVMVGVNIDNDSILGVGVTTHSETPGLGSKAKTEPGFRRQFAGLSINDSVNVKSMGGQIDALSGATITSQGVCSAVSASGQMYQRLKKQIIEKVKSFKK